MKNLRPQICYLLRDARRKAGISQSELARDCGCRQSAISMFEQGDGTKLGDAAIEQMAKRLGVDLSASDGAEEKPRSQSLVVLPETRGFCPNPHCPTNHGYQIDGRTLFRPNRSEADPVGGKFCAMCGEVLEKHCPNCGAPVHEGAVCSLCGEPYVAAV